MVKTVQAGTVRIGDGQLVLIAGPCVIESEDLALRAAESIRGVAERVGMPFVYKSSFLKDNRSSVEYYQGPGLEEGLRILERVKREVGVPVLSDVHESWQAAPAAEVLDILQIPAYLSMQTSLAVAVARTGKPVNVKKGQFLDPRDMEKVIGKIRSQGNDQILLTERGSFFGYRNLVVDIRSLAIMRGFGYPVVMDATHAVRNYGVPSADPRGGSPEFVPPIARAAVAAGVDAVFIETHPNCAEALCDASSMWPLDRLEDLLRQLVDLHAVVRRYGIL
ncbi:MAG: 3-deoxy-8-phosphooctulonate synthase [candidate division KSB1 bacterium]|nr:3-deoxy-8-phosphooctulonate synthase [candidate division KSB1 bacterium]